MDARFLVFRGRFDSGAYLVEDPPAVAMSQVNFFMLDDDERELFEMLPARGDTKMIEGRYHTTPTPPFVDELAPEGEPIIEFVNLPLAYRAVAYVHAEARRSGGSRLPPRMPRTRSR